MHNFTPSVFAVLTSSSSGPQIRAGNHTYTLNDKKKDTKRKIQKERYKKKAITQWAYYMVALRVMEQIIFL
jgi:hypothetical protein